LIFLIIFGFTERYAIFAINDDSVIERILSGRYSSEANSIVSFMTFLLGKSLSVLYSLFGTNYSWYGFFLLTINFLVGIALIRLGSLDKKSFNFWIAILALVLITPFNILTPTYTVTSILSCGVGIIGLIYALVRNTRYTEILFYVLLISVGFLIRPEALVGTVAILFPICAVFLFFNKDLVNKTKAFVSLSGILIFSTSLQIVQSIIFKRFYNTNSLIAEYLSFQSVRHEIFYTPALLKLHQAIISKDVLDGIWSNVDFILLRNWGYADLKVFSYENFQIGRDFVSGFIGFSGLLQSDLMTTIQGISQALFELLPLLIIVFGVLTSFFLFYKLGIKNKIMLIVIIFSYFFSFYYMVATLRLPFRIVFPYLVLFLISMVFFDKLLRNQIYRIYVRASLVAFVVLQVLVLQLNSELGLIGVLSSNREKFDIAKKRDFELLQIIDSGTFVGPISYLPVATQGVYFSNLKWESGNRTLALDWSTFSPSWRLTARNLELDSMNVYNSLATKKNVFWVSDAYLAEILNYYMNDRNIYRGKLCSVLKLSGKDNAEVFTFQAKETDC
jgi:hypothetical protein